MVEIVKYIIIRSIVVACVEVVQKRCVNIFNYPLQNLAKEYSNVMGFDLCRCKFILTELQENALRKLAARREYSSTGLATFKVRRIDKHSGATMVDIKCDLNSLGSDLQAAIAEKLRCRMPST